MKIRTFLLLLFALPVSLSAETLIINDPNDGWLNLRSGPGASFRIIQRVDNGIQVEEVERQGKWSNIVLPNGVDGWSFRKYMLPADSRPSGADLRYPVILSDIESQQILGVVEGNYGPRGPAMQNLCYYYGDGGSDLSLSDAFIAGYENKGFSLRTICLTMVSGIRFNPETGTRLATVQAVDIKEALSPGYSGEPGPIGPETPIELPACFARGLPLSDCTFAYDPWSGARQSASGIDRIATAGQAVLRAGKILLASGAYAGPCIGGESLNTYYNDANGNLQERSQPELESCYVETLSGPYTAGQLAREYHINQFHPEMLPLGGFVDVSPVFEAGFAYAIRADGAAGPSFELDDKALVADGKTRSSQAILESLKLRVSGQ